MACDLSTQNHTCSYVGYPNVIPYTKKHSFLSYAPDISVKNALIGHLNPKTVSLLVIWTKCEHFEVIRFLSYAANEDTNRETDWLENFTHADRVSK